MDQKKKIAILFGGCSSEYGVSLQSASAVIRHIDRNVYEPLLIGITKRGEWFLFKGAVEAIEQDQWREKGPCIPVIFSPDRQFHGMLVFHENRIEEVQLDAAFPVLHGKNGEDGTVQGMLELAAIPVVGCDAYASALCMNKQAAHKLAASAGIKVPRSVMINSDTTEEAIREVTGMLTYPLFVKPLRAGSSFGISKIFTSDELLPAVEKALEHDGDVVIEENIEGFEVGCAVLGNEELTIGKVDEIELSGGFFDFTEKYSLKTSNIHMPARIDDMTAKRIQKAAGEIYQVLGCRVFARVDMFLTPDGEIVFNEVNTIPGFTSHSRYPNMMKGIGIEFADLIAKLIALTLEDAGRAEGESA